jgi:hypothetical protein
LIKIITLVLTANGKPAILFLSAANVAANHNQSSTIAAFIAATIQKGSNLMTAMMYDNNPVFRLMANITGYGVAIGYLAVVVLVAIANAVLIALRAVCAYAIEHAKVIALALAVIGTVALCAAMPQAAVGGLLVLVFAEVTKK